MTEQNGQTQTQEQVETTALSTNSTRFVAAVERQFAAEMGTALSFTDYQKTLAQHLFLKADTQLKALEARRLDRGGQGTPITWDNINMQQLALDAVHTVSLGVDALIPNHVWPIPYWNKRISMYDLDLRLGYVGKLYARRELAVNRPLDVIIELVHETDEFTPYMRSSTNEVEGYDFKITNPFDRGKVIGGFGYIVHEDKRLNQLVIVTQRDFQKAEAGAGSKDFWAENKWRQEMQYKTVVHRVAEALPMDPRKVNSASYAYMEAKGVEDGFERHALADANGEIIDVDYSVQGDQAAGPHYTDDEMDAMDAAEAEASAGAESVNAEQSSLGGPGF